jgi:hypothetical protein
MLLSERVRAALLKSGLFAEEGDTPEQIEGKFIASMRRELGLAEGGETDDATLAAAIEAVFAASDPAPDATPVPDPTPTPVVDPAPVAEPTPVTLNEPGLDPESIPATGEIDLSAHPQFIALNTEMTGLREQNQLLMAERADQASTALLDEARRTGKTTPAMETAFLTELSRGDAAKFRSVVAALPEPTVAPTDAPRGLDGEGTPVVGMNTDAEQTFIARIREVMVSESMEYDVAYIAVKNGTVDGADVATYNAYADAAGLGVKQRRDDVRTAADHLRRQGIRVG